MAEQTEMSCRRKRREWKVRCVCGCGEKTGNFFAVGHDKRLHSFIERGAPALNCVDWCNVPLCFFGGQYADLIRARRTGKDCSGKWELEQEIGRPTCRLDRNPT